LVDGIFVNGLSIIDPFGGIANGATTSFGYNGLASGSTVPGYPVDHAVHIDLNTGSGGTTPDIQRVEINDLYLNGCARNGIVVNAALTGPFRFRRPVLKNYSAGELGSVDRAAIKNASTVEVKELYAVKSASANATTRGVMGDSQPDKTIEIVGEKGAPTCFATIAAGGTGAGIIFTAPVDCWVRKIEIVTTAAVTQNDTDYVTITVTNRDTAATLIAATSKTTGGINIAAYTPTSLNGTTQFTGANAYVSKGKSLSFAVASSNAGQALTNPSFVVHYVPYGQP
jgi:hypothetical protein